jgi:hypothetical protein
VELASYHCTGTYNFEATLRFLENFYTPGLGLYIRKGQICNRKARGNLTKYRLSSKTVSTYNVAWMVL